MEAGYRPADLDTYLQDPDRRLLVTFDDCFAGWMDLLPTLEAHAIPATFYINTAPLRDVASDGEIERYRARIGDRVGLPTLSTDEVRALAEAGHTIAAHGHAHLDMSSVSAETAVADVATNRDRLEEVLGTPVEHFAYPYGQRRHLPAAVAAGVRDLGVRSIAHGTPGLLWADPREGTVERTYWRPEDPAEHDLANLHVDGRAFVALTGRSPVP